MEYKTSLRQKLTVQREVDAEFSANLRKSDTSGLPVEAPPCNHQQFGF